jgi:hypothetical protein
MWSSSARRRLSLSDASSSYDLVSVLTRTVYNVYVSESGVNYPCAAKEDAFFQNSGGRSVEYGCEKTRRDVLFATELIDRSTNIPEVDDVVKGPVGRV